MYILWPRQVGNNFREIVFRIKTIKASWVFIKAVESKKALTQGYDLFSMRS